MSTGDDIFESSLNLEETHQEEGFQQGLECARHSLARPELPAPPLPTP
jgi:hypothetical protein